MIRIINPNACTTKRIPTYRWTMASKFGLKKKQKNKHQRHTQALLYPLLYVLPFFRSTIFWRHSWSTFEKKCGKIWCKFPFYHLFIEPEDEHVGIDASNQQSQHEISKWKRASRETQTQDANKQTPKTLV